jgi:hypothetical protein
MQVRQPKHGSTLVSILFSIAKRWPLSPPVWRWRGGGCGGGRLYWRRLLLPLRCSWQRRRGQRRRQHRWRRLAPLLPVAAVARPSAAWTTTGRTPNPPRGYGAAAAATTTRRPWRLQRRWRRRSRNGPRWLRVRVLLGGSGCWCCCSTLAPPQATCNKASGSVEAGPQVPCGPGGQGPTRFQPGPRPGGVKVGLSVPRPPGRGDAPQTRAGPAEPCRDGPGQPRVQEQARWAPGHESGLIRPGSSPAPAPPPRRRGQRARARAARSRPGGRPPPCDRVPPVHATAL